MIHTEDQLRRQPVAPQQCEPAHWPTTHVRNLGVDGMAWWQRRRRDEPASIGYQRRNDELTIVKAWDRRVIPPGAREFLIWCQIGTGSVILSWWAIDEEDARATFREWRSAPSQRISHTPKGVFCPGGYELNTALMEGWTVL